MKSLLFVFFIAAVTSAQQCLDSADNKINGRCYKFVNQQLTWQDARNWCHYRNPVTSSYLAIVPDTTTANFLASYARTIFNINEGNFWIGLARYNSSSRFQWDDGTPMNWNNFQNQNSLNYAAESLTNGKWTTYGSDSKFNFVCSYDPNAPQTGTTYPQYQTTQEWTTEPPTPTPTVKPPWCTRRNNGTIIFAYSTDSLQQDVNSALNDIVNLVRPAYGFTTFGNVRFDLKKKEAIQYHSDIKSFNASVYGHPTNSSLGYGDKTTGSDVIDVIDSFVNNQHGEPLCGSILYILVKRYPNDVNVLNLLYDLRECHIFVYFIVHTVPSGGNTTQGLFDVASKTNGFCYFMDSRNYFVVSGSGTAVMWRPYQFLAKNFAVSGSGRLELPVFRTPNLKSSAEQLLVVITYMDHALDSSFVSLNYTVASTDGSFVFVGPDKDSGFPRFGSGIIAQPSGMKGLTDFRMIIDYSYRTDQQQIIEVRMNSNYYHDFVPFASDMP